MRHHGDHKGLGMGAIPRQPVPDETHDIRIGHDGRIGIHVVGTPIAQDETLCSGVDGHGFIVQ